MSATDTQLDVAVLTRDLLREEWNSGNAVKPEFIELVTEDDRGQQRKRVRRHNEYILFAEEGERTYEYPDLGWNARTLKAQCYAEVSTAESRERRSELLGEVERIAVSNRVEPGGTTWDVLEFKPTLIDDENFGWWVAEITFTYTKRLEVI